MSTFGFYFITSFLKQAGWPKRRGLFNSDAVVDTRIADGAIDQMVDWSAALGACRPRLALKIIACMFHDKDWESENAPRILDFINETRNLWDTLGNKAPHDIVTSIKLSKDFGKMIKAKDLNYNRIRTVFEQICLEGLLWGLANPDRFKTWYELQEKSFKERLPVCKNLGLAVNAVPTLSEFLRESEEILNGYETEIGPLPSIPLKLLNDVRALGREINI